MSNRKHIAKIRILEWDYHRNGISGAPFHVFLFDDTADENTRKVGILFEKQYHCAVLDVAKLAAGTIGFGLNSYRGDVFEEQLRTVIRFPNTSTKD